MSASDAFEIGSSVLFLILGVWATTYGYGWTGEHLVGHFDWNPGFRRQLRWMGPVLAFLSVAALALTLRYAN